MTPQLASLLNATDAQIRRRPSDLPALRLALEALLAFLASPLGRTPDNCLNAGVFFSTMGFVSPEPAWAHLPDAYQSILWDMAAQLDDTFSAPDVARNFFSTPEQLLERVRTASELKPGT